MTERTIVRQFTIGTEIYDSELPQRIYEALTDDLPVIDPGLYYSMDLVFDKAVYATKDFFHYQLDKEPVLPPQGRHQETAYENQKRLLTAILNQQLEKVVEQVEGLGFDMDSSAIIGDKMENLHSVEVTLYEGEEKRYTKKGKPETHYKVFNIMPDRPFTLEQAAKAFADMLQKQIKEDAIKEYELSQHTPNLMAAWEFFRAIAHAIMTEQQSNDIEEIEILSDKLCSRAVMKSDWPLKIVAGTKAEVKESPIEPEFQIDCPEYLLYHAYQGGYWELNKVPDLKTAQRIITKNGYNLKKTASIIVLHNLQPTFYTLFEETEEGLVQVSKEEAIGKKKLMLSWAK